MDLSLLGVTPPPLPSLCPSSRGITCVLKGVDIDELSARLQQLADSSSSSVGGGGSGPPPTVSSESEEEQQPEEEEEDEEKDDGVEEDEDVEVDMVDGEAESVSTAGVRDELEEMQSNALEQEEKQEQLRAGEGLFMVCARVCVCVCVFSVGGGHMRECVCLPGWGCVGPEEEEEEEACVNRIEVDTPKRTILVHASFFVFVFSWSVHLHLCFPLAVNF